MHRDPALRWLELTADLHRAGDDLSRWPQAFANLCRALDCPKVFGNGQNIAGQRVAKDTIGRVAAQARQCASTLCRSLHDYGPQAAERKRRTCLAILDHLDRALALGALSAMPPVAAGLACPQAVEALDALGQSLLVCSPGGMLVYANLAGRDELKCGQWLSLEDERIFLGSGANRSAWRCHDPANGGSWHVPIVSRERQQADLWCQPIGSRTSDCYLLILTGGATLVAANAEGFALPGATPRQRELARLLLAGRNLSEAAREMQITRRTVIEHQRALFALSYTHRLTDLVVWLHRARKA